MNHSYTPGRYTGYINLAPSPNGATLIKPRAPPLASPNGATLIKPGATPLEVFLWTPTGILMIFALLCFFPMMQLAVDGLCTDLQISRGF